MQTKVGSFKLLPQGPLKPKGTLTMTFSGTLLVSGLKGKITLSGNVRREYADSRQGKEVYFGTGKAVIVGEVHNVQWMGRNLNGVYNGHGIFRIYGEFDKNLDTGEYWYDGDETKTYWGTYGATLSVPKQIREKIVPIPRGQKGKGGA